MVCSPQFMKENWKVIPDYPKYFVSDLGRVKRYHVRKTFYTNGYERVGLFLGHRKYRNKLIHILVLTTFRPNPRPDFYNCVDHINRNTYDNRLSNLRWSNNVLNKLNSNARGFCFCKRSRKFKAYLKHHGVEKHLGYFKYSVNARKAYKKAKREAFKKLDPDQTYDV